MESKYRMNVQDIDVELIDKWDENPNAMTDEEFNALCEELDENGLIDPIQVVGPDKNNRYFILGGHHRYDAARVIGWEKISCVILPPEQWDEEKVEFQNIKMNVLKGKLSQQKMMKWYEDKAKKYSSDALAKLTGFVDVDAFLKIVGQVKKALNNANLPKDIQDKVNDTIAEVKTVSDLSNILNHIFSTYGDTLKYNYMVFAYGGKEHLYIQCDKKTWEIAQKIKNACSEEKVDINIVMREILKDYEEVLDSAKTSEEATSESTKAE